MLPQHGWGVLLTPYLLYNTGGANNSVQVSKPPIARAVDTRFTSATEWTVVMYITENDHTELRTSNSRRVADTVLQNAARSGPVTTHDTQHERVNTTRHGLFARTRHPCEFHPYGQCGQWEHDKHA